MNKVELVKAIARKTGYVQRDVKSILEAEQEVVFAEMAKEGEVKIFDGVTLYGKKYAACERRNPATGDVVDVPEKIAPKAKFGTKVRSVVNGEE